jgi:hypothetical protein
LSYSRSEETPRKTEDWFKSDKFIFGIVILLGYMIGWAMTGVLVLTPEQAQLFSQGLATLGPVVGLIAASIWKFGKDELEERKNLSHTINTLADKAPPVTVPIEELTYGPIETESATSPVDGSVDAPWFEPDPNYET